MGEGSRQMDVNSLKKVRANSWAHVEQMGLSINPELPFLESGVALRDISEITERTLALFAAVSTAFGLSREISLRWVLNNNLQNALTAMEREQLTTESQIVAIAFQAEVDKLYALAWVLKKVALLEMSGDCPEDLIEVFPDIRAGQSASSFRASVSLRGLDEVVQACDTAYCAHWAVRNAQLRRMSVPENIVPSYVAERRSALDWVLSVRDWDDRSLDT